MLTVILLQKRGYYQEEIFLDCKNCSGHSSLDMVKEYVNMFAPDLQVNYNQFNALEKNVVHKEYISMR